LIHTSPPPFHHPHRNHLPRQKEAHVRSSI
jgi:hypothetical protein